ncbi:hypothetical protein KRR40_36125 [Niabella defluvii]|nr:hypothetical protein KRR40_36125 [Niabella sp. I65]
MPVTIQYGLRLKRQPVKEDTTGFVGQGIVIGPGKPMKRRFLYVSLTVEQTSSASLTHGIRKTWLK